MTDGAHVFIFERFLKTSPQSLISCIRSLFIIFSSVYLSLIIIRDLILSLQKILENSSFSWCRNSSFTWLFLNKNSHLFLFYIFLYSSHAIFLCASSFYLTLALFVIDDRGYKYFDIFCKLIFSQVMMIAKLQFSIFIRLFTSDS